MYKSSRHLDVHVEVVPHLVHDVGEGGAELLPVPLVIRDDVAVSVPQLPQLLLGHPAVLESGVNISCQNLYG